MTLQHLKKKPGKHGRLKSCAKKMSKNWGKHSPIRITWNVLTNLIFLVLLENFTNNSCDRTTPYIDTYISNYFQTNFGNYGKNTLR